MRRGLLFFFYILFSATIVFADESPDEFLKKQLTFSSSDITDLHAGKPISKVLDTKDKQEVVVAGATPIDVPKEVIVEAIRNITTFKKGKEVQAIGKFEKFEVDETKGLSLDDSEIDSLEKCKVEDCHWKLPAAWIEHLQQAKKDSNNFTSTANLVLRQMLVDYAKEYVSQGNKVMLQYDNDDEPLKSVDQFKDIISKSTYLAAQAPEFHEYLKDFPDKDLPAESFIYWSKEKFGFKPVISMTHVTIYQPQASEFVIASKQIYANHYFNGSLGLTFLFDRTLPDGKTGCYLVYINRSHIDALDGFLSSLRRAIAIPRIRKGLDSNLKLLRTRMEETQRLSEKK